MGNLKICTKTYKLSSGYDMPAIGLGTENGNFEENVRAIKSALEQGYRAIDTAAMYKTEEAVGEAILQNKIQRKEIFITSKLWSTDLIKERVEPALDNSLKNLKVEYLDLYLIHFPYAFEYPQSNPPKIIDHDIMVTWRELERLVKLGKIRSIGVSNFSIKKLDYLLKHATIKPCVNQIELHPYLSQPELIKYCKDNNILVTGYSPLGRSIEPKPLTDDKIVTIANKYNVSPSQIILSWAVQRGVSVVPRSNNPQRQLNNLQIIELDEDSFNILESLNRNQRLFTFEDMWGVKNAFDE